MKTLAGYAAQHVALTFEDRVAIIVLNRPAKKNPLTFESYAELVEIFTAAAGDDAVRAFVVTGAGDNFSSGGDVFEIIGPLLERDTKGLLAFTTLTGDLVKAMRSCPQPIVAAIDGVCAGAGAILAMASDIRIGTARSRIAFLFSRVGLAGCDMGACAILPRIVGQGRAAELLFTGRELSGDEAERWGFLNRLVDSEALLNEGTGFARRLAAGPSFATAMTKRMLETEWAMSVGDAITVEATAQALAMTTKDFRRAFEAFADKRKPAFEGD